jgi:hypothetical protein
VKLAGLGIPEIRIPLCQMRDGSSDRTPRISEMPVKAASRRVGEQHGAQEEPTFVAVKPGRTWIEAQNIFN